MVPNAAPCLPRMPAENASTIPRAPVAADWSRRMAGWPALATVEALFGSLEAAIRAGGGPFRGAPGAEPRPHGTRSRTLRLTRTRAAYTIVLST
jgi:hypothetical protein